MSKDFSSRKFTLGFVLLATLAFLTAAPALADGNQSGGRVCFGNSLTVPAGESAESVLGFGCNINIEQGATVRGDVADFGGNLNSAGTIGGNVAMFGGNVALSETAVVGGKIALMGGNVQQAAQAVVNGGVTRNTGKFAPPLPPGAPAAPFASGTFSRIFGFGFDILGGIVTAIAFSALGALIVIFAPEPTRRIGNAVQAKPLNVAGVGCLTLVLLPILGLLLVVTLIGIPVAFILGIAAVVAWVFGWIAIGFLTGEKILQAFKAREVLPVVAVIVGVLVLTLISQVHWIGWLVSLIVGLLGIGAVVLTRFGTRAYPAAPGMMMMPAMSAAGPSAAGTYTPGPSDIATWEDKARQVQNSTPPPSPTPVIDVESEPRAELPPPTDEGNPNT